MEDVLQLLKGRLVKILYMNADEPRVIRGTIKAFDSEMLILQTLRNEYYIKRTCILKIQPLGGGVDGGEE
jgi:hypothetical protein